MGTQGAGDGKKAWRQSDGDAAPPAAAPIANRPKRFHGGQSSVKTTSNNPVWFRIFVPIVGLAVIAAGLVILGLMIQMGSVRPVLIAWAVTDYQAPEIPLNEFAYRDVQKILKAPAFRSREGLDAANLQTHGGFENFFVGTLPTIEDETLVVYVSAHGASRSDAGYLLVSESGQDPATGYPLRRVLEQLAQCPARRKLLILDATRVGCSFELGLLGNDFVDHVKADFDAVVKKLPEDEKKSFWVFLSSDSGQTAWASRSLGHSIFGITTAYALRGGASVDAPNEKGRKDGYLTAREMVAYVADRVASWAPQYRDGAVQQPICLEHGPDFKLIRVDQELTEQGLLAEDVVINEKPAEAPAANSDDKKAPPAAAEGSAPAPEGDDWIKSIENLDKSLKPLREALTAATSATERDESKLTDDVVIGGIVELWKYRGKLAADPRGRRRPTEFSAFQLGLMRAEKLCLARQLKDAARQVLENVVPVAKSLSRAPEGVAPPFTWSTVFANPLVKEDPLLQAAATVNSAVADPGKVATLQESPLIEAGLLTSLFAEFTTPEKKWIDTDLVRFSLETRKLSASSSRLVDPRLLPLVRAPLEEADRLRRAGERSLVLRRTAAAGQALQQASANYGNIQATTTQLHNAFQIIERTAGLLVFYVRWLAADPQDREGRAEDITLLDLLITELGALDLGAGDGESKIESLARACDRLDKQANAYAEDAWNRDRWRQTMAALEIPSLPADRRERLLRGLLRMKEETPFATNTRKESISSRDWPANPVPLTAFVGYLGGSAELVADLKRLGPNLDSELTLARMDEHPEDRMARAVAGERVRDLVRERASDPPPLGVTTPDAQVPLLEFRRRVLASWRAGIVGSPTQEDDIFTEIARRYVRELLGWESDRMAMDDRSLPGAAYRRSLENIMSLARSLDPGREVLNPSTGVVLESASQIVVPAGGALATTLRFKRLSPPRPMENLRFHLDWNHDKNRLTIQANGREAQDGHLMVPLGENSSEGTWECPLVLQRLGDVEPNPRVLAWIEGDAGRIDWLPLTVNFSKPEVKPVELLVQWPDKGDQPSTIEIYPNQSVPLTVLIRKNATGPIPLRVEFQSGSVMPIDQRINLTAEMSGDIPLTILKPLRMTLGREELNIRLYRENTLLEERRLAVKLIDVTQAFQVDRSFVDKDRGELVVHVKRLVHADSQAVVSVGLSFSDDQAGGVAEFSPGTNEAIVTCKVPEVPPEGLVAQLSVAGVPRAFRFTITPDLNAVPLERPGLSILSPRHLAIYRFSTQSTALPVRLKVDVPSGRLSSDFQVRLGIDADANGQFDQGESAREIFAPGGRSVDVELTMNPEGQLIQLASQMGDIFHELRAPWVEGRRQTIRAELNIGNRLHEQSVEVFLLQNLPKISINEPIKDAKVVMGKPINVTLNHADELFEAVDTIEFGFDKDLDGKWDEDESVAPMDTGADGRVRFDKSGMARTKLPTEKLAAGRTMVMMRPRVVFEPDPGKEPETKLGEITNVPVMLEEAMVAAANKPTTGTIKGVVVIGSAPIAKADVAIMGVGQVKTDDKGRFTFEKVPAGMHTVVATTTKPFNREGKLTVTVVAGKEESIEVPIVRKDAAPMP